MHIKLFTPSAKKSWGSSLSAESGAFNQRKLPSLYYVTIVHPQFHTTAIWIVSHGPTADWVCKAMQWHSRLTPAAITFNQLEISHVSTLEICIPRFIWVKIILIIIKSSSIDPVNHAIRMQDLYIICLSAMHGCIRWVYGANLCKYRGMVDAKPYCLRWHSGGSSTAIHSRFLVFLVNPRRSAPRATHTSNTQSILASNHDVTVIPIIISIGRYMIS